MNELKYAVAVASGALPTVLLYHALDDAERVAQGIEKVTNMTVYRGVIDNGMINWEQPEFPE